MSVHLRPARRLDTNWVLSNSSPRTIRSKNELSVHNLDIAAHEILQSNLPPHLSSVKDLSASDRIVFVHLPS